MSRWRSAHRSSDVRPDCIDSRWRRVIAGESAVGPRRRQLGKRIVERQHAVVAQAQDRRRRERLRHRGDAEHGAGRGRAAVVETAAVAGHRELPLEHHPPDQGGRVVRRGVVVGERLQLSLRRIELRRRHSGRREAVEVDDGALVGAGADRLGGPLTSTSKVSRRRSHAVSRHETLTDSPTAAGPVWLTHTWVPTVVSPSSRWGCTARRHVCSMSWIIDGVDSTARGRCAGVMSAVTS